MHDIPSIPLLIILEKLYDRTYMTGGLLELAIIVLVAAALGIAAKFLKQPVILAYLATGMIIGYFGFFHLQDKEVFSVFSDLGIMFLLFLVGLEINYTSLRLVGKVSIVVGIGQVAFTALLGYFIATALGFAVLPALYIAVALTFSSTIIIVKLLSDKRALHSLHGKISVGMLLVQDLVAILILIFLGSIETTGDGVWWNLVFTMVKGIGLFVLMLFLGRKIFPPLFDKIARSHELLFLASLAWLFLLAAAVSKIGFSIEIAGFLAGLALANSSEHFEISHKLRPLRDFFILIFFVILGASVVFSNFAGLTVSVIIFSLFVLIGNPLIVLFIMGIMGYRKRTGFLTGVTVAQISEFSLVLAAMGMKLGHINESVVALITAVGLITIALSSYLIMHGEGIFSLISKPLSIFERKKTKEMELSDVGIQKPVILIGCGRTGESIVLGLPRENLLVVDFDPEVIKRFKMKGFHVLYGDVADDEVFEIAHMHTAQLVISTSPDLEDGLTLLSRLSAPEGARPKIIVRAETELEAKILYAQGADYVLLPHFTSGQYLGKTIALNPAMEILETLKENDLSLMRQIDVG